MTTSPDSSARPNAPVVDFRTVDLRGRSLSLAELREAVPRARQQTVADAEQKVTDIITAVRQRGFAALADFARAFDGVEQTHPRVPAEALQSALDGLDPAVRSALEESISRARRFADGQRPADVDVSLGDGAVVSQKWVPVARVGLYVPGGLAVYPSSVIMNVVPALAAGVESIALASPPQKDFGGLPHPTILAAAALLGIDEVYAIGGAQAIAAFAYGVPGESRDSRAGTRRRRDRAREHLRGHGQAPRQGRRGDRFRGGHHGNCHPGGLHGPPGLRCRRPDQPGRARSEGRLGPDYGFLELAADVREELELQAASTKHSQRVREALSGPQSGVVLVDDLDQGIAACDAYAAEHLEIMTADAPAVAARIRNAGAIFVGDYSPVSLGDYCAGSNHVLPTSGTAAFSSGLNVTTFLRAIQVINYSEAALGQVSGHIVSLSGAEDLPAHGDAVTVRFRAGS